MGRTAEATRRRIIDAAYELFYRRGFARVGVDAVAAQAGVTKRTLYAHFDSKDRLLAAMLEVHHGLALERIRRWSERLSGNAEAMVKALFAELAIWASKPRWSSAGFTRLVVELADLPGHPARDIARRHKAAIESAHRGLARRRVADAAPRARQIVLLLEGCQVLMLIHGDRRYAEAAARAACDWSRASASLCAIACQFHHCRRACARRAAPSQTRPPAVPRCP
jgi:AcrR family transcriptional regulator